MTSQSLNIYIAFISYLLSETYIRVCYYITIYIYDKYIFKITSTMNKFQLTVGATCFGFRFLDFVQWKVVQIP